MTREQAIQTQIDGIMDNFDFRKVEKHMAAVNWRWRNADESPTEPELRSYLRGLLKDLAKEQNYPAWQCCGGFHVFMYGDDEQKWVRMEAVFAVESWEEDGTSYDEE